MVSDLASETIYDFLMKNNAAVKNGGELFIGGCRWCKGAGTGKTDRMVGYVNKPRYIKMDELVPMSRIMTAPNVTNVCYDTAYMANISEVLFYPTSILYVDGIWKGEASCSSSQSATSSYSQPCTRCCTGRAEKGWFCHRPSTGPRRRPILRHWRPMVRSLPPNTAIRTFRLQLKSR